MRPKIIRSIAVVVAASAMFVASQGLAAPFTAGNLAVFQADTASANNTTFSIVEVNPVTNSGVQTISINGTSGVDAMRASGSATSTGYLSLTNDRSLLAFDAANSSTTSGNTNTFTARAVGTLDKDGNFVKQTTYTGVSGNQPRSATSINNTNWFIGDQNGIYSNGTSSASPSGNFRAAKSFGGEVYELSTNQTVVVGKLSAPSGGTYTGLTGLPAVADGNAVDYYLVSSGDNGSAYDVLYILQNIGGSSTAGDIEKFSLVSGSWVSNGTSASTGFGGFGLAAIDDGNGADLYITSGTGATALNKVMKVIDTAGYNAAININFVSATTVLTAATGTTFKGIDFVPVPEPTTLGLAGLVVPLLMSRRRR